MSNEIKLNNPWMVAVWPGMGQVAISAGFYLIAKMGMHLVAEFSARELFEVEHVDVKNGLIRTGRLPRSRLFAWIDPEKKRDIVVFIGEAQPPSGKYAFCKRLIEFAMSMGVSRVFTFAALATSMRLGDPARVIGAAIDQESLDELGKLDLVIMDDGHISGLNGVLLGAAAESRLRGACLLGEMPQIFAQLPFPSASQAVLETFKTMAQIDIDLSELADQAEMMNQKLNELLANVEKAVEQHNQPEEEFMSFDPPEPESKLDPADEQLIERLFEQAKLDRAKAYELKRELDRLHVFSEYEDRFLDLFKKDT